MSMARDQKFALIVLTAPVWVPLLVALETIFSRQQVRSWLCRNVWSHNWADDQRYGVEPVCIHCGTARGDE